METLPFCACLCWSAKTVPFSKEVVCFLIRSSVQAHVRCLVSHSCTLGQMKSQSNINLRSIWACLTSHQAEQHLRIALHIDLNHSVELVVDETNSMWAVIFPCKILFSRESFGLESCKSVPQVATLGARFEFCNLTLLNLGYFGGLWLRMYFGWRCCPMWEPRVPIHNCLSLLSCYSFFVLFYSGPLNRSPSWWYKIYVVTFLYAFCTSIRSKGFVKRASG